MPNMKSVRLPLPILQSAVSNVMRRNRLEGKGLHERQENGLGGFSVQRLLTSIEMHDLEILCKGARHVFPS
jgi:hypothetical protein